jgi:hypothetical protein
MNSQDILNLIKQHRREEFTNSPQLSLGELITRIEESGILAEDGDDKDIRYDFGTAIPTCLDSYRGSYDELALGYKLTGYDDSSVPRSIKAKDLLKHLKSAIGKEFTGWKGGEFKMSEQTPVWVANCGDSGSTAIVGVLKEGSYGLIILTTYIEY